MEMTNDHLITNRRITVQEKIELKYGSPIIGSSFLHSAFRHCYQAEGAKNTKHLENAFLQFCEELIADQPLAIRAKNLDDEAAKCHYSSVDALHKAAEQGAEDPYSNAEAIRYFRQMEKKVEELAYALREWAIGSAPTGLILPAEIAVRSNSNISITPRTRELGPVLHFTGDNIHRAAVSAFSCFNKWQDGENYYKELAHESANLKIIIGLPNGEKAASIWEFIQRGGAAMVKAHYALWARYYEQVDDGFEAQDVVVNINDFCRDLGYSKAKSGGYKPDAKRRAMQLLEALTNAEMTATYQVRGTKKGHTKTRRMKGTIWRRGLEAEERDTYEDLLGSARTGDPDQWVPCSFSFSPGAWYADKEWRRYNKFVGKIGAGMMRFDSRQDEWAILISGYLGTLARTGQYRNRRLKIGTILEAISKTEIIGHRQGQYREKFYRALDRLIEEKVVANWKTEGFDDSDVDPDDLAAVAEYGMKNPFPAGDWRGHIVEFEFDFAADAHRLATRRAKAITAKTKRAKKKTATKAPTPDV